MNENQEIIARSLEIAIKLNAGKELSLITNSDGNVFINDHLLSTMETVIRVIHGKNLYNLIDDCNKRDIWIYENK